MRPPALPMVTAPGTFASRKTRSDSSIIQSLNGPPLARSVPVSVPAHGYGNGCPLSVSISLKSTGWADRSTSFRMVTGPPTEGHVAAEPRIGRPHIHVRQDVVDDLGSACS